MGLLPHWLQHKVGALEGDLTSADPIMVVCIQDLSTQHQRQKVQTDELHLARKL